MIQLTLLKCYHFSETINESQVTYFFQNKNIHSFIDIFEILNVQANKITETY